MTDLPETSESLLMKVEQAAEELGKSVGSVYTSRSRVMRRLRAKVQEFQED